MQDSPQVGDMIGVGGLRLKVIHIYETHVHGRVTNTFQDDYPKGRKVWLNWSQPVIRLIRRPDFTYVSRDTPTETFLSYVDESSIIR